MVTKYRVLSLSNLITPHYVIRHVAVRKSCQLLLEVPPELDIQLLWILQKMVLKTYATMRDTNKSNNILAEATKDNLPLKVIQLDVNDDLSVQQAIREILKEDERIDVLVNNAGFAIMGAVEDTSVDEAKEQFETNFFSLYRMVQSVFTYNEKTKIRNYN